MTWKIRTAGIAPTVQLNRPKIMRSDDEITFRSTEAGEILRLTLSGPLPYRALSALDRLPLIVADCGLLLVVLTLIYVGTQRRWYPRASIRVTNAAVSWDLHGLTSKPPFRIFHVPVQRARTLVDAVAARLAIPEIMPLDSAAVWFYLICIASFTVAVAADLNGSSVGIYSALYGHGAIETPLLGAPRDIRMDEWIYQTPAILNQELRLHPFEAKHSFVGDHFVSLLANMPVRHITALFRPQFSGFFVLPIEYAYSFYWQFKALILLTGVFTFLLLITRSNLWSVSGALWFFFSAFTQWTYSWPSALPEMIGSVCFTIVFACLLIISKKTWVIMATALGTAVCGINFVLCAYPPHLIPFCWFALFFFAFWCVAYRDLIFTRNAFATRALAISGVITVTLIVGFISFEDLRTAIVAIANTVYPGSRVFEGGTFALHALVSHFMQWSETEQHVPAALGNICESTGFLWLAPAVLFGAGQVVLSRSQKFAMASLWCSFLFILLWLTAPVPSEVGKLFGMDRTGGTRGLPALGLTNVSIVALYMSTVRKRDLTGAKLKLLLRICAVFSVVLTMLVLTSDTFASFFTQSQVFLCACATTGLIMLMLEGRKVALAIALIVPQVVVYGAVNPVQRGLTVFSGSPLFTFVRNHPDVRRKKWFVYADSPLASGFLASMGCDVYTGLKYLPDIDHFPLFASAGLSPQTFNRAGFHIARALPPHTRTSAEAPVVWAVIWNVNPGDAVLKPLDIQYFAFDRQPPSAIAAQLVPLTREPIDAFWIYKSK